MHFLVELLGKLQSYLIEIIDPSSCFELSCSSDDANRKWVRQSHTINTWDNHLGVRYGVKE